MLLDWGQMFQSYEEACQRIAPKKLNREDLLIREYKNQIAFAHIIKLIGGLSFNIS